MAKKYYFSFFLIIAISICLYSRDMLLVGKADVPPVVDGKLNEKTWTDVAKSFKGVIAGWTNNRGTKLIDNQRLAFVCYDDENLYVGVKVFVEDSERLVSKGPAWLMDAVEIHMENADIGYFHFLVTCSGEKDLSSPETLEFDAASYIGKGFWSAEIAIPWKGIDMVPEKGKQIDFNITGYDYKDKWITFGPSFDGFWLPDAQEHTRKGTSVSLWMMELQ